MRSKDESVSEMLCVSGLTSWNTGLIYMTLSRLASEYPVILAGHQLNSQDLLCSWSLMVEINITEISRTACNREVTDSRMQISSGEINDQEQLS